MALSWRFSGVPPGGKSVCAGQPLVSVCEVPQSFLKKIVFAQLNGHKFVFRRVPQGGPGGGREAHQGEAAGVALCGPRRGVKGPFVV